MDQAKPGHTHRDRAVDSAVADQDDPGSPGGSDRGCTHAHAHCCAATAILTANAALPYGQLSNPPLRPPRHVA
jgi:hypothetical protein